jgi:predicted 3-demethylubiquinone-9 3-methyltransferase (glyoxalase superfamily)
LKGVTVAIVQKIAPCLWFDHQAEEAAKFYVSIFENSSIGAVTRYGKEGFEVHGRPDVRCETQAEVDRYWERLGEGGDERAQQCSWLKDKFGVSWQIVPTALFEMMSGPDKEKSGRAMQAMLQMKEVGFAGAAPGLRGVLLNG